MRLKEIQTVSEFDKLQEVWENLHVRTEKTSIFMSWDWQFNWWKYYGEKHQLKIVVLYYNENVVGILPLYIRREVIFGPFEARVARFIGTGGDTDPDDLSPLIDVKYEEDVAKRMAEYVASNIEFWDMMYLTDIPVGAPFIKAIRKAFVSNGINLEVSVCSKIRYIKLPSSWDNFLKNLSRQRRWRVRRNRRKIEEEFKAHYFVWSDLKMVDQAVDRLALLHRARWQAAKKSHSFSSQKYIDFHRSVIRACLRRDWLRLYCLETDGYLTAMLYCYRFRNQVFLMQSGFDPKMADWSAGNVLLNYAIEQAIDEGNCSFDFLRGEHRYKDELATHSRKTLSLKAWRKTIAGAGLRMRRACIPKIRDWLFSKIR